MKWGRDERKEEEERERGEKGKRNEEKGKLTSRTKVLPNFDNPKEKKEPTTANAQKDSLLPGKKSYKKISLF